MLIYNVTCKVDKSIVDEWIQWMKNTHIPEVLGTGKFDGHRFLHLLDQDETDGITYAIQYYSPTAELLNEYLTKYAPKFKKDGLDRYQNRFVAFRSVLEDI